MITIEFAIACMMIIGLLAFIAWQHRVISELKGAVQIWKDHGDELNRIHNGRVDNIKSIYESQQAEMRAMYETEIKETHQMVDEAIKQRGLKG